MMKKAGTMILACGTFLSSWLHAKSNVNATELAARIQTVSQADPIAASDLPLVGMFYSALNPTHPPAPGNFDSLPAWDLGDGNYLLDDLDSDRRLAMRAMDDSGLPMPGDGSSYTFDTNGLWLATPG